jgi:uncharacterized protein (DUF488 family)
MANPFYTIGHSTRPTGEFIAMLRDAAVAVVVDVRTVPRSRTNPQYNRETLPQTLAEHAIGYEHIAALGGLRSRQTGIAPSVNGFWQNQSFHNYADYAMGPQFAAGLARLRELGHAKPCAVMCAETLWWRCHRRIITDYLISSGETVFHLMAPAKISTASVTKGARSSASGILSYPANA